MRAQPTAIRQIDAINWMKAAESPLQRQILLWQQELLRRPTRCTGELRTQGRTSHLGTTYLHV